MKMRFAIAAAFAALAVLTAAPALADPDSTPAPAPEPAATGQCHALLDALPPGMNLPWPYTLHPCAPAPDNG